MGLSRRLYRPIPLLPSMRLVQRVGRKKGTFAVYRVEASAPPVTTAASAEPQTRFMGGWGKRETASISAVFVGLV
jgi:hypothetical protein